VSRTALGHSFVSLTVTLPISLPCLRLCWLVREFGDEYDVWAPDQRGYNNSGKPENILDYHAVKVVRDIIDLIDHAGYEKATIVGHDWGGVVAWQTAVHYPDRIEKLIVANAPLGYAFLQTIQSMTSNAFDQLSNSWYIGFFHIPTISEDRFRRHDYSFPLRNALWNAGLSKANIVKYKSVWDSSLTTMMNWYRASLLHYPVHPGYPSVVRNVQSNQVHVPTLIFWGTQDACLGTYLAEASATFCRAGVEIKYVESSHWTPHMARSQLIASIRDFITDDIV
jgi:epoxide hydrolase 4